jgi:hypothetical protein
MINPPHNTTFEIVQEWTPVDQYDHMPPTRLRIENGVQWQEVIDSDDWLYLGHCPTPLTRWQWFVYHIAHGLLMRYPLWKILPYAVKHCNPDNEVDEYGD